MLDVIIALLPAMGVSFYLFGLNAVRLVVTCVVSCVATEALCRKMMGRNVTVTDFSAVITGILLAFNLPPALPTWMAVLGSVVAIAIAKQVFGGLGYNPFNPALIGRAVLLISFTGPMTTWTAPHVTDGTTTATPLGILAEKGVYEFTRADTLNFFLGNMSGCIGEVSALAIILGGLYMLCRKCISWHIPVSFIGTVALFSAILWWSDKANNMPPMFHLLSGGVMLGAIFMATDMVTSPVTGKGMIVFGAGCGLLTVVIRKWGDCPEGVSFAILIMNAFTPLINRATKPRLFGKRRNK